MGWEDVYEVADALCAAYPDENYVGLPRERLRTLIAELPGFDGGPTPPNDGVLGVIGDLWIITAEGPDDGSPHESMA
jgi:FeS assembly protein IscX